MKNSENGCTQGVRKNSRHDFTTFFRQIDNPEFLLLKTNGQQLRAVSKTQEELSCNRILNECTSPILIALKKLAIIQYLHGFFELHVLAREAVKVLILDAK